MNHIATTLGSLLLLLGFSHSAAAADLAITCTDAANALISGASSKQSEKSYRSSSQQREIRWTSPQGHQGLCSIDSQGRVFEVRITQFPQATGETYRIDCQSTKNRRTECPLRGPATAKLERQLGRASCTRGQTWDVSKSTLWVDRNCKGRFLLTPLPQWKPYTLKCESINKKRRSCAVKSGALVSLHKQTSRNDCQQELSWGQTGDNIWVDRGCKGIFDVRPWKSENPGYQTSRERARRACATAARDHKFTVNNTRIIETGQRHFDVEIDASRNRVEVELMCRYQVSDGTARLYSY